MTSSQDIATVLIDAVRLIQNSSGRPVDGISTGTPLLGGIEGFDSLNALEAIAQVGAILDVEIPNTVLTPNGQTQPTISDVADRIRSIVENPNGTE